MNKNTLWLAILPVLAMVTLTWLFLMPVTPANPSLHGPITVIVLEPLPEKLFEEMLERGDIPNFDKLIQQGYFSSTSSTDAQSFRQAWLEIITGKNSHHVPETGTAIDTMTYKPLFDQTDVPDADPNAVDIARWYRHSSMICKKLSDYPSPPPELSFFYRPKVESDSYHHYLQNCDTFIAELLARHEKTSLIVISPGILIPCKTIWTPNQWLQANGFLATDNNGNIDWNQTRAFVASSNDNGIRINAKAVYEHGTVDDKEFGVVRKEIAKTLQNLKSMDQDEPLITTVYPAEQRFRRHYANQRPDLGFTYNNSYLPVFSDLSVASEASSNSSFVYSITQEEIRCYQSEGGWLLLSGSPFLFRTDGEKLLTTDITPTVLFLMDIPIGKDMHGRVIKPALTKNWLQKPVVTIKSHNRDNPRVEQPADLMTQ